MTNCSSLSLGNKLRSYESFNSYFLQFELNLFMVFIWSTSLVLLGPIYSPRNFKQSLNWVKVSRM